MAETPQTREPRRYLVSGMVQGVGYRYFAMRAAQRLGIGGYARNLPDGSVEVYALGSASKLAEFRKELERGPQGASVASVVEEAASLQSEFGRGFSIEH
jgi:acylphosphatase